MHRSRLQAFVIDCRVEDIDSAAAFWSQALGRPVASEATAGSNRYRELAAREGELTLILQRVEHASRIHLDIETDDVEAEVARLEALGAHKVEKVKSWWVLEAPTGQRFCVVPKMSQLFDRANVWP